jgi:hypothetical protein
MGVISDLGSPSFKWTPASGGDRSRSRVHMSDIRDIVGRGLGVKDFQPRKAKPMPPGSDPEAGPWPPSAVSLAGDLGFMFEEALENVWRVGAVEQLGGSGFAVERPGEIELDGIVMSPDGVDWVGWLLYEFKLTWRAMPERMTDDVGSKFWKYFFQLKCYMHALAMTDALLWVLYVNGDWRAQMGPRVRVYSVHYEPDELAEHWETFVLPNRDDAMLGVLERAERARAERVERVAV